MTVATARLLKLQKAFGAQAEALEYRLLRLMRIRRLRENATTEIGQALALPIVAALPVFVTSVRRLKQLEDEIAQIDRQIAVVRGQLAECHARSELSGKTARQRNSTVENAREANELFEMVTAIGRSSLPQDGGD